MSVLLALAACHPDLTPAWAYDPVWLEPAGDDGVHGFQEWGVYGPKWPAHYNDRYYVCAVVVEFVGTPSECDAEGCTFAWDTEADVAQSDCDATLVADPLFLSLRRIALGAPATGEEVAWPGQTTVSWADYGNGWEIHGEAYPEALDLGLPAPSTAWDGEAPFLSVPASAFAIAP